MNATPTPTPTPTPTFAPWERPCAAAAFIVGDADGGIFVDVRLMPAVVEPDGPVKVEVVKAEDDSEPPAPPESPVLEEDGPVAVPVKASTADALLGLAEPRAGKKFGW
jgi:hypothetical protein